MQLKHLRENYGYGPRHLSQPTGLLSWVLPGNAQACIVGIFLKQVASHACMSTSIVVPAIPAGHAEAAQQRVKSY